VKILVTGNQGYVGSVLGKIIKDKYPSCTLIGIDTGYFADKYKISAISPDRYYDYQIRKDIRSISSDDIIGTDIIIHLAAISNDPMGVEFANVTEEINLEASKRLLELASSHFVEKFIFASSCSVYGFGEGNFKTETDLIDPLTEYAKSKISFESYMEQHGGEMVRYAFRFATACGASPRIRLDLVLNDFISSAYIHNKIEVLSDGSPLRPLIDVEDMCHCFTAAIDDKHFEKYNLYNAGRDDWNFSVSEIAHAVQDNMPECKISINKDAAPDKRSYKVNFKKFNAHFPNALNSEKTFSTTIKETFACVALIKDLDENFRNSDYIRLKVLQKLKANRSLKSNLEWNF
jgi:nucleoside-diphosphate-sugar epimerase